MRLAERRLVREAVRIFFEGRLAELLHIDLSFPHFNTWQATRATIATDPRLQVANEPHRMRRMRGLVARELHEVDRVDKKKEPDQAAGKCP